MQPNERPPRQGSLRTVRGLCSAACALALLACGSEPAGPGSTAITVATVTVSPPTVELTAAGQTVQFTATATSAAGTTVGHKTFTWSSSDTSVLTISPQGLATSEGVGNATITATTDGKSGAAAVTVTSDG